MKSNANISINDSMYISKTDLEKLKIDASSGNSQAASKLANYFAFYEFNNDKFIFWLIRSAELGNTQAQYDLAYIFFDHYQDSKDKNKLDEAEKWALLAQKNGMSITNLLTDIHREIDIAQGGLRKTWTPKAQRKRLRKEAKKFLRKLKKAGKKCP